MYAKQLTPEQKRTSNPSNTLGEHMKKIVLALLLMVVGSAHAFTPTNTPTNTPTFTATSTPTATRTNTPTSGFGDQRGHVFVQAPAFLQTDGITAPPTVADPGGTTVYLAVSQSQTAAVFSTGSASARVIITVPANYMSGGTLFLHATHSSATNTVTVQADIARISMGALTSTANVYVGPATNVSTELISPLQSARFSRVFIPLSNTVGTFGVLKPGDQLNILIARTGTSGDMSAYVAEFEYKINYPLMP